LEIDFGANNLDKATKTLPLEEFPQVAAIEIVKPEEYKIGIIVF
jgi:hypothetical protein